MPADWMPGAVHRPISYRGQSGHFAHTPLGWILHVQVGTGSPYKMFENAPSGSRRFSNFWVSKTGVIEQYAETSREPWAQVSGNATYLAVETEGHPEDPLTPQQISSLGKIHAFLGTADKLANAPGQTGIGTHYMGLGAWGAHSCPDPQGHEGQGPRSHQRTAILAAAEQGDTEVITQADLDNLAHAVWAYDQSGAKAQAWSYIQDAANEATVAQIATAVVAALPPAAAGGITAEQVKQAVKDALKEGTA